MTPCPAPSSFASSDLPSSLCILLARSLVGRVVLPPNLT